MAAILLLLLMTVPGGKIGDPVPRFAADRGEGSRKIDDPFPRRDLPASITVRSPESACRPEPPQERAKSAATVTVHFSPSNECEAEIIGQVGRARNSIRVLACSFTSAPIATALTQAAARGVDVCVILDHLQSAGRGSQLAALRAAAVPVRVDAKHPIMHDKVIAIDGETVLTGSYNFSAQAHRNAENLLTVESPAITRRYLDDWERHAAHSTPPAAASPAPVAAPPPAMYRLRDRFGTTYYDRDPAVLAAYVAWVNAQATPPQVVVPSSPAPRGFRR